MALSTILIIEDDADIRDSLREALQSEGFTVHTSTNGAEALDAIEDGLRPRLVLLDLLMPVMNGWHFLQALGQNIPILVLSAYITGAKTMAEAAAIRRPIGFMRKPINLDQLLEVVRSQCGDPSASEDAHARPG